MLSIFHYLFAPHLNYGLFLWGTHVHRVSKLQRKNTVIIIIIRCVSRGSRSCSRSPPPLNLMDEESQQHKSGNSTPELFSQIVSSNDMPTSGKWSLKKRKSSSSGRVRSQFVKNTKKGRTLVVGSNKNTSLISNRRFPIFVTRVSLNTDDECVAQYIKNQPIISSCELINVGKEGSRIKSVLIQF